MRGRRHRHDNGGKDNPKARRNEGKGREEPGEKGEHLLSILRPRLRVRGGRNRRGTDAAKVTHYMQERGRRPVFWLPGFSSTLSPCCSGRFWCPVLQFIRRISAYAPFTFSVTVTSFEVRLRQNQPWLPS